MTKQEFLAMSLPYGLKLNAIELFEDKKIYDFNGFEVNEQVVHISTEEEDWHNDHVYISILHPLSDLTKEIENKGEKFVPIEYFEIGDEDSNFFEFDFGNIKLIKSLESIANNNCLHDINYIPFSVVQKLVEWHFDIAGLIDKGEAIDIKTIDGFSY